MNKIKKTNKEWKEQLTDEQYRVTREKGTERPYTGEYDQFFEKGVYHCVCCGMLLFKSDDKYDAGCGWPSFIRPLKEENIDKQPDDSIPGRLQTEVLCHHCGAHLGHVYDDGPAETGLRYCINSVALTFEKK